MRPAILDALVATYSLSTSTNAEAGLRWCQTPIACPAVTTFLAAHRQAQVGSRPPSTSSHYLYPTATIPTAGGATLPSIANDNANVASPTATNNVRNTPSTARPTAARPRAL